MARYPVVVNGASGYTGMLVMDWLIDQNIPFTAVARNAARAEEMMKQRVVRLESARYELIEAVNRVDVLAKAFQGARVVCNTVGPFARFGLTAIEAALNAGCHYIDTCGEQEYMVNVREQFGEKFRQAGLLVSPSVAYMHTVVEIAAEIALETRGIDSLETATLCRMQRTQTGGVSAGSTATIFEGYRSRQCYLWDNKLVEYPYGTEFLVTDPSFLEPVVALPWGGTSLPLYFERDPRVRNCQSSVGFYGTNVMRMVADLGKKWEAEYKHLPREAQDQVISSLVESTTPSMPPRERTTLQRTVDFAIGRGHLAAVRVTIHGMMPYVTTGAMQTAAAIKLIENDVSKTGFVSASQALGHRYLLGFLEQRGLARVTVQQL